MLSRTKRWYPYCPSNSTYKVKFENNILYCVYIYSILGLCCSSPYFYGKRNTPFFSFLCLYLSTSHLLTYFHIIDGMEVYFSSRPFVPSICGKFDGTGSRITVDSYCQLCRVRAPNVIIGQSVIKPETSVGGWKPSQIKKRFGGGFFPDCYTQILSTDLNSVENYEILIIIDKY